MRSEIKGLNDNFQDVVEELAEFNDMDPRKKMDSLQRKIVKSAFDELFYPFQRTFSVDMKEHRCLIDQCLSLTKDHDRQLGSFHREMQALKQNIMRTLKNQEEDNKLLDREIDRMQMIDRTKVQHARNSIFVPDNGSIIPGLDVFGACRSTNPSYPDQMSTGLGDDFPPTQRNVLTANEISGICERFPDRRGHTGAPSQRQRVLITRSQEATARPKTKGRNATLNVSNFLNTTINKGLDDSIMSAGNGSTPVNFARSPGMNPPNTGGGYKRSL